MAETSLTECYIGHWCLPLWTTSSCHDDWLHIAIKMHLTVFHIYMSWKCMFPEGGQLYISDFLCCMNTVMHFSSTCSYSSLSALQTTYMYNVLRYCITNIFQSTYRYGTTFFWTAIITKFYQTVPVIQFWDILQ